MTKANTFQISISNCRNITALEDGPLTITHHHMHLYLAKNGTGKTTISKALRFCADKSPESYNELKSFSYLQTENAAIKPLLRCSPQIKSIAVFDSDWIDNHCFSDSSIHENAFELYVSDNAIRKKMKERDNILGRLKKLLSHDQVDTFIKQLKDINKRIGTPAKGAFRATAPCRPSGWHGTQIVLFCMMGRSALTAERGIQPSWANAGITMRQESQQG